MSKLRLKHGKNYFSPSQLKKLYLSVGQLNAYLKRAFQPTNAMALGTAVHTMVLEPSEWDDRYVVFDDTKIREAVGGKRPTATKEYKSWLHEFEEDNAGKVAIPLNDYNIVKLIEKKLTETGVMDAFFTDGEAERTITGVAKGYNKEFDALCIVDYDTDFLSIDLKTTSKPLHKFRYDANELGYDIQASLTNAINGKEFVFVVVQTVEPFDIGVYTLSDYFKNRGVEKINTALDNYNDYKDKDTSVVLNFEL